MKKRNIIYIYYTIVAIAMMMIPILITLTHTGKSKKTFENDFVDISNEWHIDMNEKTSEPIECDTFGKYMDEKEGVLNVYYKLPENFYDSYLIYRSKDIYTKVYVEDELLYETEVYESHLYNKSPGNIWNSVKILDKYAGKWVRIEIKMVYDKNAISLDHIYFGDKTDIIFQYINSKISAIIISFILITIGIIIFTTNIYEFFSKNISNVGNISFALYTVMLGIWSLCETNVLQFWVDDIRIIQLIDNMIMFLGVMPMLFFLDKHYDILDNMFARVFCYIDISGILFCFIMQVTNISDFHHFIVIAWTAFIIFSIVLFYSSTKSLYRKQKENILDITNQLHILGFVLMTVAGVIEALRYAGADSSDRAVMLRTGILLFTVCFAIGNQIQNYRMVAQGAKYDVIKNLAYKDGLTELGNRTSYLEKIKEYKANMPNKLGIIFLDMNNLKRVNDTYGHDAGDNYITASANIINNSFGKYGECYRIGGDEFCSFIEGIDINSIYAQAKKEFYDLMKEENDKLEDDYKIEIAHGFAMFEEGKSVSIDDVIQESDDLMYKNKMEFKSESK